MRSHEKKEETETFSRLYTHAAATYAAGLFARTIVAIAASLELRKTKQNQAILISNKTVCSSIVVGARIRM